MAAAVARRTEKRKAKAAAKAAAVVGRGRGLCRRLAAAAAEMARAAAAAAAAAAAMSPPGPLGSGVTTAAAAAAMAAAAVMAAATGIDSLSLPLLSPFDLPLTYLRPTFDLPSCLPFLQRFRTLEACSRGLCAELDVAMAGLRARLEVRRALAVRRAPPPRSDRFFQK
jgi:hypothetical protein